MDRDTAELVDASWQELYDAMCLQDRWTRRAMTLLAQTVSESPDVLDAGLVSGLAALTGGLVRVRDHLVSSICYESGLARLRDAAWGAFPDLREASRRNSTARSAEELEQALAFDFDRDMEDLDVLAGFVHVLRDEIDELSRPEQGT